MCTSMIAVYEHSQRCIHDSTGVTAYLLGVHLLGKALPALSGLTQAPEHKSCRKPDLPARVWRTVSQGGGGGGGQWGASKPAEPMPAQLNAYECPPLITTGTCLTF